MANNDEVLITREQLTEVQANKAKEMMVDFKEFLKKEGLASILPIEAFQKMIIRTLAIHSCLVEEELFGEFDWDNKKFNKILY